MVKINEMRNNSQETQKKWQINGNVGVKAGTYLGEPIIGPSLGGNIQKGGFHAGADVTVGTALQGNVKIGYEHEIAEDLSADYSVVANASTPWKRSVVDITNNIHGDEILIRETHSLKYREYHANVGLKTGITYTSKNDRLKCGLAAELGYYGGHDVKQTFKSKILPEDHPQKETVVECRAGSGFYATPSVDLSYKLHKDKNVFLKADANLLQANVGINFKF